MFKRLVLISACVSLPLLVAFTQSGGATQSGGTGAAGVEQSTEQTAAYFQTVDELLATAKEEYSAGNSDAANEALIEAYLENFEYVEAPLEEVDHELVEELEETLRVNLPEMVNAGVSPEEFNAAVDAALAELDQAEALLK